MTSYNIQTLKTFFQTGDVPDGNDYGNAWESYVNIVETSIQNMGGPLGTTELVTPRVSAGTINVTTQLTIVGGFSAANITGNTLGVTTASAASLYADNITCSGNVSANNVNINGEFIRTVATIAASGTTLATANVVSAPVTRLTSVSDGTATGVRLMANKTGLTQYLYNETATSANLWPCTGGQINVLGSGAAFALAGSTLYTIVHIKASGYAIK